MLYYGAKWLVKGASSFAESIGISKIVIGLTVVAFGTSAPELVISILSSIKGKSMIAIGNVVGSNICNIALVLGLSALFHPVISSRQVVKRDIPIMLGVSLFLLLLSFDSKLGRLDGAILFGGIIVYVYMNYFFSKKGFEHRDDGPDASFESDVEKTSPVKIRPIKIRFAGFRIRQIGLTLLGTGVVAAGAHVVVDSAVKIMTILDVSEKFTGLTIVAFGTSLPELATSVVAAHRKEMDISIGNLVGSNVFNIFSVLGASSLIRPILIQGGFVQSGLLIDYLVMLLTSFLLWLMMRKDCTVTRMDGFVLLSCYAGYLVFLILKL